MKTITWKSRMIGFVALIGTGAVFGAVSEAQRVNDFGLIDHQGTYHQLSKYRHKKAVVIISQQNGCEENYAKLAKYKLMQSNFNDDDIVYLMMNSSGQDSLAAIRSEAANFELGLPVLLDESQLVAEALNIQQAGEVVIIDPKSRRIVYRGPTDVTAREENPESGTYFVATALNDLLAGREIKQATTLPVEGCPTAFPVRDKHLAQVPDYVNDVAPILAENCAICHREGGIAPFAMNSYAMVKGWAPMMRETLMTKRMPPAQVDPNVQHFDNARYIDQEQLQTLVHWFDAGAPRGDNKTDPLTALTWPNEEWQLGEPDYVVYSPRTEIPATGVIDYYHPNIELPFDEDKWVRAVQFIPEQKEVLHHLIARVVPGEYQRDVEGSDGGTRRFLEGYAPGKDDATIFPDNMGVFIPKGHKLNLSVHYTTSGRATSDSTRIGLYFYDKPPKYEFKTESVSHNGKAIEIPPGVHEHKMFQSHVFDREVVLHAMRPHMHTRGKYMSFKVVYPDNTTQDLMNVPNYNFNWQPTYRLTKPILLPAGSRVLISGAFDNSENQVGNYDPTAFAYGGEQTWDEMFIGYLTYHETGNDEENKLTSK